MKVYEQKIKEISEIQKEINEELDAIESYESENESLKEKISDYENEYESNPNGNRFDFDYVYELQEQIEINERLIIRCELEIDIHENLIIEKLNTKNYQTV